MVTPFHKAEQNLECILLYIPLATTATSCSIILKDHSMEAFFKYKYCKDMQKHKLKDQM